MRDTRRSGGLASIERDLEIRARIQGFAGWPDDDSQPQIELVRADQHGDFRLSEYALTTQHDLHLPLFVFSRNGPPAKTVRLSILDDEEWKTALADGPQGLLELARPLDEQPLEFAFFAPRGIGPADWGGDETVRTHIERRFNLLGQTLDGMRVWDIRQAVKALKFLADAKNPDANQPATNLSVVLEGKSDLGINGLYAAIFEHSVSEVVLIDTPASHREGPTYLNVDRVLTLPQAAALATQHAHVKVVGGNEGLLDFANKIRDNVDKTTK